MTSQPGSGIRDNFQRGAVGDFLRANLKPAAKVSIVSAFFTIYAHAALKGELATIAQLRFLFGEPRFVKSLDPDKTDKKAFRIEDSGLKLDNQLAQRRVARECAEWLGRKAEIRSVKRPGFLHGKLYHIDNGGVAEAILGSSNFTVQGLGLAPDGRNNVELNLIVDSNRDRRDLKQWFDELWDDTALVEDVKAEVLAYLAQLYQNHSPEFIYHKTLYHLFGDYLTTQQEVDLQAGPINLRDTAIWQTLFSFQRDGVKGAINKILRHNGCILADSVGLGKTYEALAVIKYFELRNSRVLVLCPKKLRENWTVYQGTNGSALNPFVRDRFGYTVLSHTDLSRESGLAGDTNLATFSWGAYDLVVIDESHNFRNATPGSGERKSRYQRLMDDIIKSGVQTKVLMLSATPVNNNLKDLRNQIRFISVGNDEAFAGEPLKIPNFQETLRIAQATFNEWVKTNRQRDVNALLESLSTEFFKLLDELTIARSRRHILRYYSDSVAALGGFPERAKPEAIYPPVDSQDRFISYDRLNKEIDKYQLALFNPWKYVRAEARSRYTDGKVKGFTQGQREMYLIGMMKINFLKRLESSVHAFALTMEHTIEKIEALEDRIRNFQNALRSAGVKDALDAADLLELVADDDEALDAFRVGKEYEYRLADLDLDAWLADLGDDKQQLERLRASAEMVDPTRDAKLTELKQRIAQKVRQPTLTNDGRPNRKVLVFTAFADTAEYLYDALQPWARDELKIHIALVTGRDDNKTTLGKTEFTQILTNFSPLSKLRARVKDMPQDQKIDLLIATDCISEGQNLQDCDLLVNYDIHWNPVRVIQRFGRIDRIGSRNQTVQMVNFWPTKDLDKYITLKARVEARMALVDLTATQEDNLLKVASPETLEGLAAQDLKYRDQQLLRLRDEVLDLEDVSEGLTLNQFTLDDFRVDLSNYIRANQDQLKDAPLGLYAVVAKDAGVAAPGVIFCLQQRGETQGMKDYNPLSPYFLVYVRRTGEVRFTFAQPKQILELYRGLCAGKAEPDEALCQWFDAQTNNGAGMTAFDGLVRAALDSLSRKATDRIITEVTTRRGALIPRLSEQPAAAEFDLVTWLVIAD